MAKRFRPVVESIRYKNSPYVARTAFTLRKATQMECVSLCSKKGQQSILQHSSTNDVKTFKWEAVSRELKCRAPTLYHALRAACFHPRKKKTISGRPMAAAILLRGRNQFLNMPQSVILHTGHCSKWYCCFTQSVYSLICFCDTT